MLSAALSRWQGRQLSQKATRNCSPSRWTGCLISSPTASHETVTPDVGRRLMCISCAPATGRGRRIYAQDRAKPEPRLNNAETRRAVRAGVGHAMRRRTRRSMFCSAALPSWTFAFDIWVQSTQRRGPERRSGGGPGGRRQIHPGPPGHVVVRLRRETTTAPLPLPAPASE